MRIALFGLAFVIAVLAFGTEPSRAQNYPWCAEYGRGMGGSTNCGFSTLAQCRAAISGNGGYCYQNPQYGYGSTKPTPQRRLPRR